MVERVRRQPPVELVSKRQLAEMLSVSTATLDRWRRLGRFPKAIALSDQSVRWPLDAVRAWLAEKEGGDA